MTRSDGPVPGYRRTRDYRDRNPETRAAERSRNAARQRALVLLAQWHPDDFRRFYESEVAFAGLRPRARARADQPDGSGAGENRGSTTP